MRDDEYEEGQLTLAAIGYAVEAIPSGKPIETVGGELMEKYVGNDSRLPTWWPWDESWWRPSDDPIRNLEKAGALIAAEIDRLQRAARRKVTASV